MAADEKTIFNFALAHLGQAMIMSLEDPSQEARFCKRFYTETRDEVMASHRWNFAMSSLSPARLGGTAPFGWRYQYQLPAECLRVLDVGGFSNRERPGHYEVAGGVLLTNQSSPEVRCLKRIE